MSLAYDPVLFDWDGCLVRSLDVWMQAYHDGFAELGLSPTRREIGAQLGDWGGARALGVPDAGYDAWLAGVVARAQAGLQQVEPYDGAQRLLMKLREAGAHTALITTSTHALLDPVLGRTGFGPLFDVVITAEDVPRHKPDPAPLHEALRRLGAPPLAAVMIGDSDKDLGAARNAGIDAILMYPPDHETYYDVEALRSLAPAHVCASFAELGRVLLPEG